MNPEEQLCALCTCEGITPFHDKLEETVGKPLTAETIDILQVNVGNRCNLSCKHCHVLASPRRRERMSKETFQGCIEAVKNLGISTVDLTGGSPEMNPNTKWFIEKLSDLNVRKIVRSNLAILAEPEYEDYADFYANNNVDVVASLPDPDNVKTNRMRGEGVYDKIIEVMKKLNEKGYGKKVSERMLSLVHNPVGAYLPGDQGALEEDYRRRLEGEQDIHFTNLYCITNMPVGRYLEYLIQSGNYEDYMGELVSAFNPASLENVMCKTTLSVGWDGLLFDCDFNQMLGLPVNSSVQSIGSADLACLNEREIIVNNHCYGCTAGAGSSCQGATT